MVKLIILIGALVTLSSYEHVKPLDRNYLTKEHMGLNPYATETALQEHQYVSCEATQGGMGSGGTSDCGCT